MREEAYRQDAAAKGYGAAAEKSLDPNHSTEPHAHDEAAYLHILDGRMGLGIDTGGDIVTVSLAPGSTIEVPAGCRHTEQVGAESVSRNRRLGARITVARTIASTSGS